MFIFVSVDESTYFIFKTCIGELINIFFFFCALYCIEKNFHIVSRETIVISNNTIMGGCDANSILGVRMAFDAIHALTR